MRSVNAFSGDGDKPGGENSPPSSSLPLQDTRENGYYPESMTRNPRRVKAFLAVSHLWRHNRILKAQPETKVKEV